MENLVGKVISYDGNKKYNKRYALIIRHYKQNVPESFDPENDRLEDVETIKVDVYKVKKDKEDKFIIKKMEKKEKDKKELTKEVEVFQVNWFSNEEEFSPYILREATKVVE